MTESFTEGIAFIFEGATEKIFYIKLLEYFASLNAEATFEKNFSEEDAEFYYIWKDSNKTLLIKIDTVFTITQLTNADPWFENKCASRHAIPWTVYLCYDTDRANISKFYSGDWLHLRKTLQKNSATIIDLAANADIEDIFLLDLESICKFLNIDTIPSTELKGRKGKAKLKALFRKAGKTYHEGERAESLI